MNRSPTCEVCHERHHYPHPWFGLRTMQEGKSARPITMTETSCPIHCESCKVTWGQERGQESRQSGIKKLVGEPGCQSFGEILCIVVGSLRVATRKSNIPNRSVDV